MTTWAPITDRTVETDWGRSRGGSPVNGLVIHHQADGAGPDSLQYMIGWNDRGSHPSYAIDDDAGATVVGIIHPDLTPSSTGYDLDRGAVTIEVANTGGAPDYAVSDAALEKIAQLIAHHAGESPRAGHPIEVNDPGRTQAGFWVAWHSQYFATACPGDYLRARIPAIVARANEIRGGAPAPAPAPTPAPAGGATAPAYPLLAGSYFGPRYPLSNRQSVSGFYSHRGDLMRWQQRMADRGWTIAVDGRYGDETRGVAIAFQTEKGLAVDGLIGPETWRAAWELPVT